MDHAHIKNNKHVKYKTSVINSFQGNERKPFYHFYKSDHCELNLKF